MAIRDVPLDTIDDNPYNPRKHYAPAKVKEMAQSLQENGLRQVPEGRQVDGRVQLAYGHMRLRGFHYNLSHKETGNWFSMPVDVKPISDQDMFHLAMEENLRRTDITHIEVARCIEALNKTFPDILDEDIAKKHGMTAANVSNMKRVLRLPEKFLEKIDGGIITFTQGRELLTLEGIPDAEELMSSALAGINTTGNKQYSKPNTVEGLQQSIHSTINGHFPPLDKENSSYHFGLLFDTRAAGCLECAKMIRTHPTKSGTAHYCTDEACWKKKTDEHKAKAAAVAKAKMEAEVLERAAKDVARRTPEPAADISQEKSEPAVPNYTLEKRGTSWIALDGQGRVLAIRYDKKAAEDEAKASFEPVATVVDPKPEEFVLNHTYRVVTKPGIACPHFDVTAQNLSIAVEALELKSADVESAKVYKSSGKIGTGGDVSAGWSKCTEPLEKADLRDKQMKEAREKANQERKSGEIPCETCDRDPICGREGFYSSEEGDRYVCDTWEPSESHAVVPTEVPTKMQTIPEETLQKAKAAAGTRAEVLDLNDICSGNQYSRQMKQGYILLSDELHHIDEPEECLERCTHGFHYAFDSKYPGEKEIFVCSDPKCLTKKKGDLTRKKNAAGQALKNAERKAIQEAIQSAGNRPRGLMMLVIYAQLKGSHVSSYYSGSSKSPEKWLWDKLSAGTKEGERNVNALMKKLDKLDEAELPKLLVEMMFYYLADHGDTGSYQIKTELPLRWMGVDIQLEEKEKVSVGQG